MATNGTSNTHLKWCGWHVSGYATPGGSHGMPGIKDIPKEVTRTHLPKIVCIFFNVCHGRGLVYTEIERVVNMIKGSQKWAG